MSVRVIGGDAKGRLLKSPTGEKTRPTSNLVRSAIFSMLEPYLDAARVLDLFSGTG
ncbi:MAG: 16S rRNA (guanine(966)-N(2))-methyltransferase RsmD, partial [SAR202 cluster bacterium]|nr:16S rRNA (guanine(966)-N(2))-methyltransferase RsmD [SAR202 cluster bacterium]